MHTTSVSAANKAQQLSQFMRLCVEKKLPLAVAKVNGRHYAVSLLSPSATVFENINLGKSCGFLASYEVVDSVSLNIHSNILSAVSGDLSKFRTCYSANMLSASPNFQGFGVNVEYRLGREILEIPVPVAFRGKNKTGLVHSLSPNASNVNVFHKDGGMVVYSPVTSPEIYEFNEVETSLKVYSGVFVPEGMGIREVRVRVCECAIQVVRSGWMDVIVGDNNRVPPSVLGSVELPDGFVQIGREAAADALKIVHGIFMEKVEKNAIYMIDNSYLPEAIRDTLLEFFRLSLPGE